MMADGIKIIADENGLFNIYDDTYDVIIHCESEEEQNMVISGDMKLMRMAVEHFIQAMRTKAIILSEHM